MPTPQQKSSTPSTYLYEIEGGSRAIELSIDGCSTEQAARTITEPCTEHTAYQVGGKRRSQTTLDEKGLKKNHDTFLAISAYFGPFRVFERATGQT